MSVRPLLGGRKQPRRLLLAQYLRAVEELSLVVGSVLVLELGGHGLGLVGSVGNTDKVTPSDAVKRVAGSANLTVN